MKSIIFFFMYKNKLRFEFNLYFSSITKKTWLKGAAINNKLLYDFSLIVFNSLSSDFKISIEFQIEVSETFPKIRAFVINKKLSAYCYNHSNSQLIKINLSYKEKKSNSRYKKKRRNISNLILFYLFIDQQLGNKE